MNKIKTMQNQAKRMGFDVSDKECELILEKINKEKPKTFQEIAKIVSEATKGKIQTRD